MTTGGSSNNDDENQPKPGGDLLEQIRLGKTLKKAPPKSDTQSVASAPRSGGGLWGLLQGALAFIRPSHENSSEGSDERSDFDDDLDADNRSYFSRSSTPAANITRATSGSSTPGPQRDSAVRPTLQVPVGKAASRRASTQGGSVYESAASSPLSSPELSRRPFPVPPVVGSGQPSAAVVTSTGPTIAVSTVERDTEFQRLQEALNQSQRELSQVRQSLEEAERTTSLLQSTQVNSQNAVTELERTLAIRVTEIQQMQTRIDEQQRRLTQLEALPSQSAIPHDDTLRHQELENFNGMVRELQLAQGSIRTLQADRERDAEAREQDRQTLQRVQAEVARFEAQEQQRLGELQRLQNEIARFETQEQQRLRELEEALNMLPPPMDENVPQPVANTGPSGDTRPSPALSVTASLKSDAGSVTPSQSSSASIVPGAVKRFDQRSPFDDQPPPSSTNRNKIPYQRRK